MNIFNVILLSFTICIDAFILCLLAKIKKKKYVFIIPFVFSFFQSLFLYIGYSLGSCIEIYLKDYLKYVVFFIFSFMGIKLILDTFIKKDTESASINSIKSITLQAILTSFDSLFLGMPLSFNSNNYFTFILIIATTTFIICLIGILLRNKISKNYDDKINLIGSIILFFFAFKSLI